MLTSASLQTLPPASRRCSPPSPSPSLPASSSSSSCCSPALQSTLAKHETLEKLLYKPPTLPPWSCWTSGTRKVRPPGKVRAVSAMSRCRKLLTLSLYRLGYKETSGDVRHRRGDVA